MSGRHSTRLSQPATTRGLGRHFTSPIKPHDKKKRQLAMLVPGNAVKWKKLEDEICALLVAPSELEQSPRSTIVAAPSSPIIQVEEPLEAFPMEVEDLPVMSDDEDASHSATTQHMRTPCFTARSTSACAGWKALIPTIVDPFLKYTAAMFHQPLMSLGSWLSSCTSSCQEQKLTAVLCLFFDRK